MGKASSNKKVARAAKAGGGRARAAGERNILFPTALVAVVILGTVLVVYARDDRVGTALEPPLIGAHWHAGTGFYVCDEFTAGLGEFSSPAGLATHDTSGIIHIEPSSSAGAGDNATLVNTIEYAVEALGGDVLDDDRLGIPGGDTYVEGEDSCPEADGDPLIQVAVWDGPVAAQDGADPDRILTTDFDSIRFDEDGRLFTLAFAPEGADIPPPPNVADLAAATGIAPEEEPVPDTGSVPEEGSTPADGGGTDSPGADAPSATPSEETPATTVPGEPTSTIEPDS